MTEDAASERGSSNMGAPSALMDERQPRMVAGGGPRSLARIGRSQTFVIDKDAILAEEAGIKLPADGPPMPVPRSTVPSVPASRPRTGAAGPAGVSSEQRRLGRRQLSLTSERPTLRATLASTRTAKSLTELGQALKAVEGLEGTQDALDGGKGTQSVSRRASAATVAVKPETPEGVARPPDTQTTPEPKVTPVPAPRRRRRFDPIETGGTQAEERENTAPHVAPPAADKGSSGAAQTSQRVDTEQGQQPQLARGQSDQTLPAEGPGEKGEELIAHQQQTAPTTTLGKHGFASGSQGVSGRRLLLRRQNTVADGSRPSVAADTGSNSLADKPATDTATDESAVRRKSSDSGKRLPSHGGVVVVADVHMSDARVGEAEPPAVLSSTVEYEPYEEPGEDATSGSQQLHTKNEFRKRSPQRQTDSPPRPPGNEEELGSEAQKETPSGEENSRSEHPGNEKERRGRLPKGSPPREINSRPQSPGHEEQRRGQLAQHHTGRQPASTEATQLSQQPYPIVREPSPGKRPPDILETLLVSRDETLSASRERRENPEACKPYPVTRKRQSLPSETRARLQDIIKRNLETRESEQCGLISRDELDRRLRDTATALSDFYRSPALSAELIENYKNMIERCKKTRDALLSGRELNVDIDENANPELAESCRHALYWLRLLAGPGGPEVPDDVLSFLLCPNIRTRPINCYQFTERKTYV